MPRTRSLDTIRRDEQIYAMFLQKETPPKIAQHFGISTRRVLQILAAFHPEAEEDTDRAVHRARLELLYEEVQSMLVAPGYKMAPNGRLAEDGEGNLIADIGTKAEVAKVQLQVLESMRRLDARDKPQQQNVRHTHEVAQQESAAAIAREKAEAEQARLDRAEREELLALRRRVSVVPGEVVRELPAGGG